VIPSLLVFAYLAVVLYIGVFAFRRGRDTGEDYFLASRGLKPLVFLLTMFGSNMTAFAILGSSGLAYRRGIGVYGLMASASGFVIPLSMLFIGTRLWQVGKRHGHMTQVQYFRDRYDSPGLGTLLFVLTAAMLVPYIVIGVMGGGATLEAISTTVAADGTRHAFVGYEAGGAIVALVVMSYVFFGGMRGTAWVNAFQTTLFLVFGAVAFVLIGRALGGFGAVMHALASNPKTAPLLTRERIPPGEFASYMLIPFSTIMFPHIAITCFSAEKVTHFKKTVVLYPLCILAIWLPSVYLGVVGAARFPGLGAGETDDVILRLLAAFTGPVTAGLLGAGIMACVMASDSQILALCTMFTEDVFVHFGGRRRFGERAQVWTGRAFIVGITVVAYAIALALKHRAGIFELAIRFAFSGYAALTPVMVAALFWRRSTKWGAFAATAWVAASLAATWWIQAASTGIAPAPGRPPVAVFPSLGRMFLRTAGGLTFYDFLPVLPMFVGSALLVVGVSLATPPPARATLARYFPSEPERAPAAEVAA
jgi:SSS family solute:Na+ symporter